MNELNPNNMRPNVETGIVKPPNQELGGYAHVGSSHVLTHALDVVTSPNISQEFHDYPDKVGGSFPLGKKASEVKPSNQDLRFSVANARMGVPGSAEQWVPGSVPVRGGGPTGKNPSFLKKA